MSIRFALLGLLICVMVSPVRSQSLRPALDCGRIAACLPMELALGRGYERIVVRRDSLGDLLRLELRVRGRRPQEAPREHSLVIAGSDETMGCGEFMTPAGVPVLGYSGEGHPIILTSAGELEIMDSLIGVGCPNCAELRTVPGYRVAGRLPTPAWDLWALGYDPRTFGYSDTGALYVPDGAGNCIEVRAVGRFRLAAASACSGLEEVGNFERPVSGLRLQPAEWLFRSANRRHALFLRAGACT